MGTRAVISVKGMGRVLATHWDGYPEGLGAALKRKRPKNMSDLIAVASRFSINYAHPSILAKANKVMIEKLYNKKTGKWEVGYDWIAKTGKFVYDITKGEDFWEYEYFVNFKTGNVTWVKL